MPNLPAIVLTCFVLVGLLALFSIIAVSLRRVVPTNMVHIVQLGKRTIIYGKDQTAGNVYYEVPFFIPAFGVTVIKLPVSNFDVPLDNYPAYDAGRLPFMVDVRAFFVIQNADMAAKRISSYEDLKRQLTEILRGSVRSVLAIHKLEEILGIRAELGKTFTEQVDEQLAQYGVTTVKSIEFMDMKDAPDSTVIHDIMAKDKARINKESRIQIANNQQEAQMAEVSANQLVDMRRQEALQTVGQRTAEQEKAVGIAKQQAQQATLVETRTTAEREMEVNRVREVTQAEINRSVAEVGAAQSKNVAVITAEAAQQTTVIAATADRDKKTLVAEGDLNAALKNADGLRAVGEAQGRAKEALNLADVTPQITLAKEIGANESYQKYLIGIKQIEIGGNVGVAQAGALREADIRIIANGGDVVSGMSSVSDVFSSKGGTQLTGWLQSLTASEEGQAILRRMGLGVAETPPAPKKGKDAQLPQA